VYDKRGLVVEKRTESNNGAIISITSQYDKDGRIVKTSQTINNQNLSTLLEYDALGNIIKKTDAAGNSVNYEYDYRGKLLAETKQIVSSQD